MHNNRGIGFSFVAAVTLIIAFLMSLPMVHAQTRLNDKDMTSLMRNLRDDTKSFRSSFDVSVHKSTIRKTSQEKDARLLVARFQKQTEVMLNHFKQTKKGDTDVPSVLNTAEQIDKLLYSLQLDSDTTSKWEKVKAELHQISSAYGIPENYGGNVAASSGEQGSCLQAIGAVRANQLVGECLNVSPATHPPCNVQNSCSLIVSEIKRGCGLLGSSAPSYCNEYK